MTPLTDTATVTVTVTCNRVAPTANPDEINTNEDDTDGETINVLSNDEDPEGDDLTLVSVNDVAVGTITSSTDGTVTYIPGEEAKDECRRVAPQPGFSLEVPYTMRDEDDLIEASSVIVINVLCNRGAIEAVPDEMTTDEDSTTSKNVLRNDNDPEGDPEVTLTITRLTQPDYQI